MLDSNKNRELAKAFGLILEAKKQYDEVEDPLLIKLEQIRSYRNEQYNRQVLKHKDEIWDTLEHKLFSTRNTTRVFNLSSVQRKIFAVAASVLLAVFAGLFYYATQPSLIQSSQSQIATVQLQDGSTVTLRPYSTLWKYSSIWNNKPEYELQGEGFFEIVPQQNHLYTLHAGKGVIRVLGTRFIASNWGEQTQIFLEEGAVEITHITNNNKAILQPNQAVTISGEKMEVIENTNEAEYVDWMNNTLVFTNKTARYIFNELEQHFNIQIKNREQFNDIRISGSLQLTDLEQALFDLELVLGGKFQKLADNRYQFNLD